MIVLRHSAKFDLTCTIAHSRPINLVSLKVSLALLLIPLAIILAILTNLQRVAVKVTNLYYSLKINLKFYYQALTYIPIPYSA